MPKAKRVRGRRQTRRPAPQKCPRRKENGRPRGTLKRFLFDETKLGFFLKYECPAIYDVLMRILRSADDAAPRVELIEFICKNSSDPSINKKKYTRYLDEYKRDGLYCHRAQVLTQNRKIYYERIRKNKLNEYISNNSDRIIKELIS